ncbi:MAG: hypothetical protein ABIC18_02210 [Candidatus Omnitrophota bacterium]
MKKIKLKELLNEISQDKNKFAIVVFAVVIFLSLDLFFVLKSQMRMLTTISPKIVGLKNNLKEFNSDLARMQGKKQGVQEIQERSIVSAGQMPWVIEEISRLANQKQIKIFQIKPIRELPPAKTKTRKQPVVDTGQYSSTLISLDISAGYHQLAGFLAELENHHILFEVQELQMQPSDENVFEHAIELKLKTYVSNQ